MDDGQSKPSKLLTFFLAFMMIASGTMNTIFIKYQNYQSFLCTEDYECQICPEDAPEGECIDFEQPFFQTMFTFIGETLCFFVYYMLLFYWRCKSCYSKDVSSSGPDIKSNLTGARKLLFLIPTLCDIISTTLLNLALIYTYASVYQMLRGAIVVFTGVFSVIFLKRKQQAHHWIGIVMVVAGVTFVGISPIIFKKDEQEPAKNPILGDALIILAQIFTASQYIFEEKFLSKYNVSPVEGVGQEGVYGISILLVIVPTLALTIGNKNEIGNLFDIRFAGEVFLQHPTILVPSILCLFTYSMSNFFGVTITKLLSATSRSTIEALRTLSVWCFGLIVGWEKFIWLQVIGFVILALGTFIYNEIITIPFLKYTTTERVIDNEEQMEPLLNLSDSESSDLLDENE